MAGRIREKRVEYLEPIVEHVHIKHIHPVEKKRIEIGRNLTIVILASIGVVILILALII